MKKRGHFPRQNLGSKGVAGKIFRNKELAECHAGGNFSRRCKTGCGVFAHDASVSAFWKVSKGSSSQRSWGRMWKNRGRLRTHQGQCVYTGMLRQLPTDSEFPNGRPHRSQSRAFRNSSRSPIHRANLHACFGATTGSPERKSPNCMSPIHC